MWKIGNVVIKNKIVLAPMAGISNSAYRTIVKEMGAGLIFAEMVSDKAVMYNNQKTLDMLYMTDYERPLAQQIFGSDKESFVIAAKSIYETMKPDIIDINMGCPVPKVALRAQAGSALLKDPAKVYDIVKAVVASVPIPVTVKIRSGWDNDNINAKEIAKICEQAGAKAISIHARTRNQGYSGKANWAIIKEVKDSVSIPVIGNGDITSCYLAKQMLDETGCDAVMIGRGVLGNPWLVKECVAYLDNGTEPTNITINDRLDMIYNHLEKLIALKNEKTALLEIRSHAIWYLKGVNGSSELRQKLAKAKSTSEVYFDIEEFKRTITN